MILVCFSSKVCWTRLNIETISNDEKCAISHLVIVVLCSLFFSWSWTHDFYIFLQLPLEPHGDLKWNCTQVTHFMKLVFDGSPSGFKCINHFLLVITPLWAKCEDETHTPKSGNLESSGTPKNSELDCRGQNTSHRGVIFTVGKVLKCRCPKWPPMNHLDICSPSYGQKKGRESNWQFDSQSLKVGNRPDSDVSRKSAT
jgi:hypothetical protein